MCVGYPLNDATEPEPAVFSLPAHEEEEHEARPTSSYESWSWSRRQHGKSVRETLYAAGM